MFTSSLLGVSKILCLCLSVMLGMFIPWHLGMCLFLCAFCVTVFLLEIEIIWKQVIQTWSWIYFCTFLMNFDLLHYKEKIPPAAFSWTCFLGAVKLLFCDCEIAGRSTDDRLNHILWTKLLVCIRFYFCWIIKISHMFHFYSFSNETKG